MDHTIRDATDDDLASITNIFNQAIPDGNAQWTERLHTIEERTAWMRDREHHGAPVLVAERDDLVVGVATYADFRDSTSREGFRFVCEHSVYVDRAARGTGVAHALMNELEAHARTHGFTQMVATIDELNPASIAFHARRGFVEVGRMPNIGFTFGTWRTMVLMQLDLTAELS